MVTFIDMIAYLSDFPIFIMCSGVLVERFIEKCRSFKIEIRIAVTI